MRLRDGGAPMGKPEFKEIALVHGGTEVLASGFNIVDGKVLDCGRELQMVEVITLQAAYIRHGHAPREIGVLAEDFLDTSPTRIAADIDNGRAEDQPMSRTGSFCVGIIKCARLVAHRLRYTVDQVRIPSRAHGD